MKTHKHRLPWKYLYSEISGCDDAMIARIYSGSESAALLAKAVGASEADNIGAFIVRACNAHDDLVDALEKIARFCYQPENKDLLFMDATDHMERIARSALAKARGEA